jgi:hypothetical protein
LAGDPAHPANPLAVNSATVPAPKVYVFDPTDQRPFPSPSKCAPPSSHYVFDQRTEAYRSDEQGAIFTVLPDQPGYVPIVAEVHVDSKSEHCQSIKSARTLLARAGQEVDLPLTSDLPRRSVTDGNYLAWAIVDPGADVRPVGPNGLGPIHLGWYNKFLLAYLDGGYIPTEASSKAGPGDPFTVMRTQQLLTPDQILAFDGAGNTVPGPGGLGKGYDILDARRGDDGYSPLCEIVGFTPSDPLHPRKDKAALDASELGSAHTLGFVYCLQVE